NTWVLQINATGGSPVTGAAMTVTPFMPDHQHGSGKTVVVEPMSEPGQYQLAPVNMWMPGLWETTISASSASGTDQVVFKFCIPS
ncbi:MAG: FixH family protein, partial [Kofleriaceae bacterium]